MDSAAQQVVFATSALTCDLFFRAPPDAPQDWTCSACKSRICAPADAGQGVLHCSACTLSFTLCHSCRKDLIPELQCNSDGCPMLPGIGHNSKQSFCHRVFGNNTCGSNAWQCPQCDASEKAKRFQIEEEKRKIELRMHEEQRALFLRMQAEEQLQREQQRLREEEERIRLQAEEARQRLERQRLEDELNQQKRLEEAMREAARQQSVATAKKVSERMFKEKAEAEAAALQLEKQVMEWAEEFCVGRWVQVTAKGPYFNKFALVIVRPSDDATLQIRLFNENVR